MSRYKIEGLGTIESYHKAIEGFYPGLVVLRDHNMYLADPGINPGSLVYSYDTASGIMTLGGHNNMLVLYFCFKDGRTGVFTMMNDQGLSDQTCMGLYWYSLDIRYYSNGIKMYDRVAIERSYNIKNIIS